MVVTRHMDLTWRPQIVNNIYLLPHLLTVTQFLNTNVHWANSGPTWGRQLAPRTLLSYIRVAWYQIHESVAAERTAWWPLIAIPESKVHGTNVGPSWGRQDQGGPHVGPMNFAIWDAPICLHHDDEALSLRLRNIPTQWLSHSFITSFHIIRMRRNRERPERAAKRQTLSYVYFGDIIRQNSTHKFGKIC